ncbi:hypothetical protein [Bacillus pinisoli]|uniref:hypothetical protein n=1 Tax=Bacillus pinisoli TaxID=2901866 RepID=UPI001FF54787|nr:hypothetical protein [Bacillus pinisoli]
MVQLWLTLTVLFVMLLLGLAVFYYSIRISVDPKDAVAIDPLPKGSDKTKT